MSFFIFMADGEHGKGLVGTFINPVLVFDYENINRVWQLISDALGFDPPLESVAGVFHNNTHEGADKDKGLSQNLTENMA